MDLPRQAKQNIFLSLSGDDLERCKAVSSAWYFYIFNEIWHSRYPRHVLTERLEDNWRQGRFTVAEARLDIEFPFIIDSMSTRMVCIRTPGNTPLNSAIIRVLDVTSLQYWDIPNLFGDIQRFASNFFAVALSDNLIGVRTLLNAFGAPVWNLQVFCLKRKCKVVDENVLNLVHFHASQTNENPDTLILFRGLHYKRKKDFLSVIFHTGFRKWETWDQIHITISLCIGICEAFACQDT